jgi:hypothetical protein
MHVLFESYTLFPSRLSADNFASRNEELFKYLLWVFLPVDTVIFVCVKLLDLFLGLFNFSFLPKST